MAKVSTINRHLAVISEAVKNFDFEVARVAVFANIGKPCPSFAQANSELASIMPDDLKLSAGDLEDVLLQVNQRYESGTSKHKMNFIRNWSAKRLQMIKFNVEMGKSVQTSVMPTVSEFIVATFSIDANSVPAFVTQNGSSSALSGSAQFNILSETNGKIFDCLNAMGFSDGD